MKKNYEINVTAFARVLVLGATSEEEAQKIAMESVDSGDTQIEEASTHDIVADENLDRARRYADVVVPDRST